MHGSTATYTAYRRDTPKSLCIHHPDLKYSIQMLNFLVKRKEMGQLSQDTACLCVIKETCSVWSPGQRAQLLWHERWHSWWLQGWRISQEAPLPLLLEVPSVLPSSWSIKYSLQKCKWLTASRALHAYPKHLFPHCTGLLFKAMLLEKGHENKSETFSLITASDTPLTDWHNLLNQISSWNILHLPSLAPS